MREIEFYNITSVPGSITFRFKEKNNGIEYENSAYIQFEAFQAPSDVIALVFGTFCGTVYDTISIDLAISHDVYEYLQSHLQTVLTVRSIGSESFFPVDEYEEKKVCDSDSKAGESLFLNYSGGIDSLALLSCLPPETKMVSIYFEGLEREYNFFKKTNTYIVKTDIRRKLSIDSNSWEFMGFASILYKEFLLQKNTRGYATFGTVLEAGGASILKRIDTVYPNAAYIGTEFELVRFTNALTELGTMLLAAYYKPEELAESVKSLANPGSEKLYRKECLANAACIMQGKSPIITQYHYPRRKQKFGEYFATDFLAICIAKVMGISYVRDLYTELPAGFEAFIQCHSLAFYAKARQDMLSSEPKDLVDYFCKKLFDAGLSFYTEEDYEEMDAVRQFLQSAYDNLNNAKSEKEFDFLVNEQILRRNYKKVVLYGAGKVGKDYYTQLEREGIDVHWVDEKYTYYRGLGLNVYPVDSFDPNEYDSIIVATTNVLYQEEIKELLMKRMISEEKIFII